VPGGLLVAAVWTEPARVPYHTLPRELLARYRPIPPLDPDAPGTFRYADAARLQGDLEAAGFRVRHIEDHEVEVIEAATDAELVAWVRALGLTRIVVAENPAAPGAGR
jgi:hypothetical protein